MKSLDVVDIDSDAEVPNFYYDCDFCDDFFPSRKKLAEHLEHHTCSDPSCSSCNRSSSNQTCRTTQKGGSKKSNRNLITSKSHGEDKICSIRSSMSGKRVVWKKELPLQRGTHVFFCTECDETFKSKHYLRQHELLECEICHEDITLSEDNLSNDEEDQMLTSAEGQFKCADCEASFTKKFNLQRHVKNLHTARSHVSVLNHVPVRKSFKCPLCKKEYTSKQILQRHLNLHLHAKYFICKTCKKTFYQKRYRDDHMLTHSNVRKFGCTLCEKTYKTRYGLSKHLTAYHPSAKNTGKTAVSSDDESD